MDGSTLYEVKTALVASLQDRPRLAEVKVSHQSPVIAKDLKSLTAHDAIWLGDGSGSLSVDVVQGLPISLDERYTLEVLIQSLRFKGTQASADVSAVAMLGEVFGTISNDPTLGLDPEPFLRCQVLPTSWEHFTGRLEGVPGHGSSFLVRLEVNARLALS